MKSAFITGANRGLGLGFVKYLSSEGFQVFAGMRNVNDFNTIGENVFPIQIDVANDTSIENAYKEVASKTNSLELLINNAGLNKDSATDGNKDIVCKLNQLDRSSLLNMFDVNSIGPLMVVKHFLGLLHNDPSFIIHISSDRASFHSEIPNTSANYGYRASKIALNMMAFASVEDLPQNIKTFTVHPGSVLTDMNPRGTQKPLEQAKKIVAITEEWREEKNGAFLRPSGDFYPL